MPEKEKIYVNCTSGGPIFVHVIDGKIVRIRPLIFDDKVDAPSWKLEIEGKTYTPPRKACISSYTLTERVKVYSEDRIKYPMKRVDFDPNGERHTENRGKSGYERITWEEAFDLVAGEMKRIRETYGIEAITSRCSSHHNWGNIGYRTNTWSRFFNTIGFSETWDNPDSWEGWHWGATHAYGFFWRLGNIEHYDMLEEALKYTDLIVHWGNDPDTTRGNYGGNEAANWRLWIKEKGIKQIFIDPFLNYTAAVLSDKWLAPRPGTDSALALGIAYVWIEEGTYDKQYVKDKTLGFEEFEKYVKGEDDGIPKTPEWAAELSDIPARIIRALAREWASKRTMLAAGTRGGMGGACKAAYAHEWARFMVFLQAMQGLGKPGVNIWGTTTGVPFNHTIHFPGYAEWGINKLAEKPAVNPVKQKLYRPILPEAILEPPIEWLGDGFCGQSLEQQFNKHVYPMEGYNEVRMFYRYGGAFIGTMCDTNRWVKMYQSPKLEFVVNQDCWWSTETKFADVILPACTNLERNDISEWGNAGGYSEHLSILCNHRVFVYQQKCIEPLWESKSDYQIFSELAKRLGYYEAYTEGNSEEDWCEKMFMASDLPKYIDFETFRKRGYFVAPQLENHKPTPALRWYYEGRDADTPEYNPKKAAGKAKELGTFSGKIEFVSESLKKFTPDHPERAPMPHYIDSWEGHKSELAKKYPLQFISPHPRHSYHSHNDHKVLWLNEIPGHRQYKDNYGWQVIRIHPVDAEQRGIKQGDIVKLYNDRGGVLGIADVTQRVRPGLIHSYESSANYDPLEPGKAGSIDKGGCVNLVTSARMMSKNVAGMAPNSCLVEISKWEA